MILWVFSHKHQNDYLHYYVNELKTLQVIDIFRMQTTTTTLTTMTLTNDKYILNWSHFCCAGYISYISSSMVCNTFHSLIENRMILNESFRKCVFDGKSSFFYLSMRCVRCECMMFCKATGFTQLYKLVLFFS